MCPPCPDNFPQQAFDNVSFYCNQFLNLRMQQSVSSEISVTPTKFKLGQMHSFIGICYSFKSKVNPNYTSS